MDTSRASAVLVDTDVFSYLMRSGTPQAQIYRPHVEGKLVSVSFVTVGELLFGAYRKKWGQQKIADLMERFRAVTIVPYDFEICKTYADLRSKLEATGTPVADNDLWIAACAVRHSIPLVSNNRTDFEKTPGLVLISEAAVIREIQAQGTLPLEPGSAVAADPSDVSNGQEPPSSQSPPAS